jgi:hypothetical protein
MRLRLLLSLIIFFGLPATGFAGPEWRPTKDADEIALYDGDRQLGNYHYGRGHYRPFDPATRTWGPPREPPIPPPPRSNFGVETDKVGRSGERYLLNGQPASREQARHALARGGTLTDDSGRLRLTVIGTREEQRRVLNDLATHPALQPLRDRVLAAGYDPQHWAVAGMGFMPGVHVQAPGGRVLHRSGHYPGPERLAEALRRARPDYDPGKDPDLTSPFRLPLALPNLPPWAWLALAVLAWVAVQPYLPDVQAALRKLTTRRPSATDELLREILNRLPPSRETKP